MITFDPDVLAERRTELEQEMGAPGFWDDQEHAAEISTEHSRVQRKLDRYEQLMRDYEDARELYSMDGGMEAEIVDSIAPLKHDLDRLEEEALFSGEFDAGDAVVTLQSDVGGTDAQDFTEMLLRMYERWAQHRGFAIDVIEASPGEEAGLKSATFEVDAPYAFGQLSVEAGTHRLVRMSPFNSAGKRQTSFAAVEVIPLLEESGVIEVPESDIRVDVFRSSGPGGQSVNTTDSAVRITHLPTGIVVSMQNEKSQIQNRAAAMRVLASRLLLLRREEEAPKKKELAGVITASWGDQIRSYVLAPYQMVKDLRTEHEVGNVQAVLDGDLDEFMEAWLRWRRQAS